MIIGYRWDLVNFIDSTPKTVGAEFYLMPAIFLQESPWRQDNAGPPEGRPGP